MNEDNSKKLENNSQTIDSKYIQQHLANERTFLAAVRTAIAIIGVGFLVANFDIKMKKGLSPIKDLLTDIIEVSSLVMGILTIVIATVSYIKNINAINNQTFRTSKGTVILLSTLIIIVTLVFSVYFLIL